MRVQPGESDVHVVFGSNGEPLQSLIGTGAGATAVVENLSSKCQRELGGKTVLGISGQPFPNRVVTNRDTILFVTIESVTAQGELRDRFPGRDQFVDAALVVTVSCRRSGPWMKLTVTLVVLVGSQRQLRPDGVSMVESLNVVPPVGQMETIAVILRLKA